MMEHVVKKGECLAKIAHQYGFADYQALYNHPENRRLKEQRPNPNILHPGDVIVIPDHTHKFAPLASGKVHTVRIKRPRKLLRLRLLGPLGEPLAGVEYTLTLGNGDGSIAKPRHTGKTDDSGRLEVPVPVTVQRAALEVEGRVLQLQLGALLPLGEAPDSGHRGVHTRLRNLGYQTTIPEPSSPAAEAALRAFQEDQKLSGSGQLDAATLDKLVSEHGC